MIGIVNELDVPMALETEVEFHAFLALEPRTVDRLLPSQRSVRIQAPLPKPRSGGTYAETAVAVCGPATPGLAGQPGSIRLGRILWIARGAEEVEEATVAVDDGDVARQPALVCLQVFALVTGQSAELEDPIDDFDVLLPARPVQRCSTNSSSSTLRLRHSSKN